MELSKRRHSLLGTTMALMGGFALSLLAPLSGVAAASPVVSATPSVTGPIPLYIGGFAAAGIIDSSSHLEQTVVGPNKNYWVSVYQGLGAGDLLWVGGTTHLAKGYVVLPAGFDPIDGIKFHKEIYFMNANPGSCPIGVLNPAAIASATPTSTKDGISMWTAATISGALTCAGQRSIFGGSTSTTHSLGKDRIKTDPAYGVWFAGSYSPPLGPQTYTQLAWFKTTSPGPILSFSNTANPANATQYDRHLWIDSTGHLVAGVYNNGFDEIKSTGTNTYNDGKWHLAAVTLGSTGFDLYVDGSLVASNPSITTAQPYNGYWSVGTGHIPSNWPDSPSSQNFKGSLFGVSVLGNGLSAAQISTLYGEASVSSYLDAVSSDSVGTPLLNLPLDTQFQPQTSLYADISTGDTGYLSTGGPIASGSYTSFDGSGGMGILPTVATGSSLYQVSDSATVSEYPINTSVDKAMTAQGGFAYVGNSSNTKIYDYTLNSIATDTLAIPAQEYYLGTTNTGSLGDLRYDPQASSGELWYIRESQGIVGYIDPFLTSHEYQVAGNTGPVEGMQLDSSGNLWISMGSAGGGIKFASIDPTKLSTSGTTLTPTFYSLPTGLPTSGADDFALTNGTPTFLDLGPILALTNSDNTTHRVIIGSQFQYSITASVSNLSPVPETKPIVVSDPMPQGITATAVTGGAGWTCSPVSSSNQTINCSFTPSQSGLSPASQLPPITVSAYANGTPGTVITNIASVSSSDTYPAVTASDQITLVAAPTPPPSSTIPTAPSTQSTTPPSTTVPGPTSIANVAVPSGSPTSTSTPKAVVVPQTHTGKPWSSLNYWYLVSAAGLVGSALIWPRLRRSRHRS